MQRSSCRVGEYPPYFEIKEKNDFVPMLSQPTPSYCAPTCSASNAALALCRKRFVHANIDYEEMEKTEAFRPAWEAAR